jgi:hypothetical protein
MGTPKLSFGVDSTLVNIEYFSKGDMEFNIPRYQRLYVWGDDQVKTLLSDLYDASASGKELFYLGGVLIVRADPSTKIFDLIDGQQRFTTLWLLCLEMGGSLLSFTTTSGENPRLHFAIREEVTEYFKKALIDRASSENLQISKDNLSLRRIESARTHIRTFLFEKKNDKSWAKFESFIRNKVKLIITEVPPDADLNKLFEVINNRGLQLQHHEILKAGILQHIGNRQERIRFGKIWNACADMDNYIEKTARMEVFRNIQEAFRPDKDTLDIDIMTNIMKETSYKVSKPVTLNSILSNKVIIPDESELPGAIENSPEAVDDELEEVRSILSFPQLLLHTLRIYLHQQPGKSDITRINEKDLLKIFAEYADITNEQQARRFIRLLWDVRVVFDLYIIKWVKTEDEGEIHLIKKLIKRNVYRKQTYYLRREKPIVNDGFTLLQSMLYHSQQITTHYWLTPLLNKALTCRDKNVLYAYLRELDNRLFSSTEMGSLPERTWKYLGKDLSTTQPSYQLEVYDEKLGVDFPHYLFYKLDFVLWYLLKDHKGDKWKSYRMTAKNSVEHVSPQTARREDVYTIIHDNLNDFGNLVLVSRGINSEYGNNIYRVKRENFIAKEKFDSLKSALIFENEIWSDDLCEKHKGHIITLLSRYFSEN